MPTYEYHCDACDYNFDEFQSMSEAPLKKCPQCKKPKLRRVFGTGAAILFKGSGFYETDYRSESYKQAAKADQESSSKSSSNGADGTTGTNGATSTGAGGKGKKSESKSSKS
ncbi:MAG TPA: zinc ribbon domain-containing protein [Gemmataceae bacterium]|nr:zinc ribbon domain-containing protein [Gemmataceae bacterium]